MLKILCLEDDPDDFEIVNTVLESSGMEMTSKMVDSKEKFIAELAAFHPHVILSDHALPQFDSTEALAICQAMRSRVPFILVTGAVSDEFAVHCIKQGAEDYVLKSNLSRLPSAIKNALKHKEAREARAAAMASLANRNEELIKINKELDSLIYSVSHNLRAPLMSTLGLMHLVEIESNPESLSRYHQLMKTSLLKLDDTLKEILDYAQNASAELKIEEINLREILNETLEKMQFMPGFERIKTQITSRSSVSFYSDYYRISVIINNLLSNAIKYHDPEKENCFFNVTIDVDPQLVILSFQDNGIEIQPDAVSKVFNKFYRATNLTQGTGLGLYIVKEAVEKLLGSVVVESEIGVGTTFLIEIPNHQPVV